MERKIREILISIGISIIIGTSMGLIFPDTNYYLMTLSEPKREITEISSSEQKKHPINEGGNL